MYGATVFPSEMVLRYFTGMTIPMTLTSSISPFGANFTFGKPIHHTISGEYI